MGSEVVTTLPTSITGIDKEKNVVVLVIAAHREDSEGNSIALTSSQARAALANAMASLEVTAGTEVLGTSTCMLLPDVELADGESLTLRISADVIATSTNGDAEQE